MKPFSLYKAFGECFFANTALFFRD